MSNPSANTQSKGSPFSPGIPLEAHRPIFGREDAFRFISGELKRFKSVNLIGERRMGKTSLLKHLLGNQDKYLQPHTQQPPPVLIHVDVRLWQAGFPKPHLYVVGRGPRWLQPNLLNLVPPMRRTLWS